jgi:hypothetical protein
MPNLDQTKHIDFIRELTLNELQAVSGGGDDSGDDLGGDFDGGGPVPALRPREALLTGDGKATIKRSLKMPNLDRIKLDKPIRELTLDDWNAVSGGDGNTPNDLNLPKPPDDCAWWNPFC